MTSSLGEAVIDLHYHACPDIRQRRFTIAQAGRAYARIGGWVVVKSHLSSTAAQARQARAYGLPVSGSVVLNDTAGGVRADVVRQAVRDHGPDSPARLVVHLPTVSGARVTDDHGRLRREVSEVVRAARDLPVVLATGHCNRAEVLELVTEATRLGLSRLLVTHATDPLTGLSPADVGDLTDIAGLHVELTALTRLLGHQDAAAFQATLNAHPRIVYSSDLGQFDQPEIPEWLALTARWLTEAGLTKERRRAVTRTNAAALLAM